MAIQSRSRAPRTSGGQFAPKPAGSQSQHARGTSAQPHLTSRDNDHATASSGEEHNGPPAKRRKLAIRGRQSTLDEWNNAQSRQPKPPAKVTVARPHGELLQTINGVRTALDLREDDLSLPTSGVATPEPGRVPKAARAISKQEEKRTLRSQDDGPRLKSELAIYFPNYEDIIFDTPREDEFITNDTALYVTDDAAKPKSEQGSPKSPKNFKTSPSHSRKYSNGVQSMLTPQRSLSNGMNGSPRLNLDMIARGVSENTEDPLTDEHYLKSHRRAERKEKQLRNIEKERAMHEKVQLDRLLEGLQGHDWLKVLGITGITDGEAKKYEPKRDYFIAEVQALVDKFKQWKEQEKRVRLDREAAVLAKDESDEPDSKEGSEEPSSNDLNASAARQLQQETASAIKQQSFTSKSSKGKEPVPASPLRFTKPMLPPPPEVPITSFYAKRHLRDAALGKNRRGRNLYAFGHPMPELEERDFVLPDDYVTEDTLRANAREKRRRKRESAANATS